MDQLTDFSKDLGFLTGKRAEMTVTLQEWCAINSGSNNLEGLANMHKALAKGFSVLGAPIEVLPSEPHSIVTGAVMWLSNLWVIAFVSFRDPKRP